MIDKNLLRQLGWSDDLISEIMRTSEMLKTRDRSFQPIDEPILNPRSVSGTTLYIDKQETNTDLRLSIITFEKL